MTTTSIDTHLGVVVGDDGDESLERMFTSLGKLIVVKKREIESTGVGVRIKFAAVTVQWDVTGEGWQYEGALGKIRGPWEEGKDV
jgi:hypothetical protein